MSETKRRRSPKVKNPTTGEFLRPDDAKQVNKLRRARHGAKVAQRSGNPAKRAEAMKDEPTIVNGIRQVYLDDHASKQ
jgi:hypothetical protein